LKIAPPDADGARPRLARRLPQVEHHERALNRWAGPGFTNRPPNKAQTEAPSNKTASNEIEITCLKINLIGDRVHLLLIS
jgi:hypothetical protein